MSSTSWTAIGSNSPALIHSATFAAETASRALEDVYSTTDSTETARQLALKQAVRLRMLDPIVARRRLAGMLQRRGFEYDVIKPVIDQVLGDEP